MHGLRGHRFLRLTTLELRLKFAQASPDVGCLGIERFWGSCFYLAGDRLNLRPLETD